MSHHCDQKTLSQSLQSLTLFLYSCSSSYCNLGRFFCTIALSFQDVKIYTSMDLLDLVLDLYGYIHAFRLFSLIWGLWKANSLQGPAEGKFLAAELHLSYRPRCYTWPNCPYHHIPIIYLYTYISYPINHYFLIAPGKFLTALPQVKC